MPTSMTTVLVMKTVCHVSIISNSCVTLWLVCSFLLQVLVLMMTILICNKTVVLVMKTVCHVSIISTSCACVTLWLVCSFLLQGLVLMLICNETVSIAHSCTVLVFKKSFFFQIIIVNTCVRIQWSTSTHDSLQVRSQRVQNGATSLQLVYKLYAWHLHTV